MSGQKTIVEAPRGVYCGSRKSGIKKKTISPLKENCGCPRDLLLRPKCATRNTECLQKHEASSLMTRNDTRTRTNSTDTEDLGTRGGQSR